MQSAICWVRVAGVSHRLCRLISKILDNPISYIGQGVEPALLAKKLRAQKLTRALPKLGYQVTLTPARTGG